MRVWHIVSHNGKGELRQVEQEKPQPGHGEVLVRIRAASLNHRDLYILDEFGSHPANTSVVPLSDGAGEIVALGEGSNRFQVGDRVALTFFPGWIDGPPRAEVLPSRGDVGTPGVLSEYLVANEQSMLPLPAYLTYAEGATLPCAGLTAWHALAAGEFKAGDTVLLQGTGGVSLFGLQFARAVGARSIITSRSDEKLARVRALGADETLNTTTTPQWDEKVRELTEGRGVDHILEVGGIETLPRSLKAIRMEGNISLIGGLGGFTGAVEMSELRRSFAIIRTIYVGNRASFADMNTFLTQHQIHPVIDRTFSFEQAPEAYRYLEEGAHIGKVVIEF